MSHKLARPERFELPTPRFVVLPALTIVKAALAVTSTARSASMPARGIPSMRSVTSFDWPARQSRRPMRRARIEYSKEAGTDAGLLPENLTTRYVGDPSLMQRPPFFEQRCPHIRDVLTAERPAVVVRLPVRQERLDHVGTVLGFFRP